MEDHPLIKIGYTPSPRIDRNISKANFILINGFKYGIKRVIISLIERLKQGEIKKGIEFDWNGQFISFEYSLIASEKGWRIPLIPTLLGPIRICIYPRIFRSNKVIKATLTREKIRILKSLNICISFIEI